MPEVIELVRSKEFINEVVTGKQFTKSTCVPNSRNANVIIPLSKYKIECKSRGKEVKLLLTSVNNNKDTFSIIFRFGMSGTFTWSDGDVPKHTRFSFFTEDGSGLHYVDVRRFGGWSVGDWSAGRGPCVYLECSDFKRNVLDNLSDSAFNRSMPEVMLNQKYFNGVGNYLRAEILGRFDRSPFETARDYIKHNPSVLNMCNQVAVESYDMQTYGGFNEWQSIYRKGNSVKDKTGRTFWYDSKFEEACRNMYNS